MVLWNHPPAAVLFCRGLYPKTGLILSLSKDPLFGNALYSIGR
jgi:hypothetical protein